MLLDNVLVEKWYIPVKQEEPLGVCLNAAIHLAQEGMGLSTKSCGKLFILSLFPQANLMATPIANGLLKTLFQKPFER